MQVGWRTEKMARMRLKGEDQPSLPRLLSRRTDGDHAPHGGVAILERKRQRPRQGGDSFVGGHVRGRLAAVDQQLSAWADGRDDGLHQDLARRGRGYPLLPHHHLIGCGEV